MKTPRNLIDILTPLRFGRTCIPNFESPAHIKEFNRLSLQLLYGTGDAELNRLIISVCIRSGKSQWFSVLLPAWYLIHNPNKKVIICSATQERAMEFSSQVRQLVDKWGYLNNVSIDPKWKAKDRFKIKGTDGGLYAFGSTSSIAGLGCHLLILDDIIRDQQSAENETQRDVLQQWVNAEALSRLEPGGKVIFVGSRRHQDDCSARLLKLNDDIPLLQNKWKEILFPAINEAGEALWPERYPVEKLLQIKSELILQGQGWVWEGLYQQNPFGNPEKSEWNTYLYNQDDIWYDNAPQSGVLFTVVALDSAAGSKSKSGDYNALTYLIYTADGTVWVEDSLVIRTNLAEIEDSAVEFIRKYSPTGVIVETNGYADYVAQNIITKFGPGCPMFTKKSTIDKNVRIRAMLTPLLAQKKLKFKNTFYNKLGMGQMLAFPNGKHDDFPDCITLGCSLIHDLWQEKLDGGNS